MSLPNKSTFNSIGGEINNYSPPTDPTTDLDAVADDIARADNAAMTRTIPRAWLLFTVTGGVVTILNTDYDGVYGNAVSYKPIPTYLGGGDYIFDFPASIVDARGVTQLVNLTYGKCNTESAGYTIHAKRLSATQFSVKMTISGVFTDPPAGDKSLLEVT